MREVLHAKAAAPEGLPENSAGVFVCLRNWASYTSIELMRPFATDPLAHRNAGGGYFIWWRDWGLVIDPGLGFGQAFSCSGVRAEER